YIIIILIYNLKGRPYKVGPKFIFKFIKEYLNIKETRVLFLSYSSLYTYKELVILF
ncbi:hypothetical protein V2W45_1243429, partial [Cenococcum geophilum]